MKPEDFFQIPLVEKVGAGVMMRGDEVKYWQERDTDRKWKHFYFLGRISTGLSSGGLPLFEVLKGKVSSSHLSHSTLLSRVWIKAQDKVSRALMKRTELKDIKLKQWHLKASARDPKSVLNSGSLFLTLCYKVSRVVTSDDEQTIFSRLSNWFSLISTNLNLISTDSHQLSAQMLLRINWCRKVSSLWSVLVTFLTAR